MNVLICFCYISYIVDKIECHLIQIRARHTASKNIAIYFFNLHYEVHIKFIGTEVSNLMVSSILVSYFLVVYLFQLYSIPAILNYEA